MDVDAFWLNDAKLATMAAQSPTTRWGQELMQEAWPKRYPQLLSSDTYRGCAIALSALSANIHKGIGVAEVEQIIEDVHNSLQASILLPAGSAILGGAALTVTNAWETAHCGITTNQLAEAYESELIYVARMFQAARNHEIVGHRLP